MSRVTVHNRRENKKNKKNQHPHERTTTYNHVKTTHTPKIKKKKCLRASYFGFIKIASSSGVINARAKPWVDASVLKVKSLSHSAQPSVKRRPNPITLGGKENAISHSIKKSTIYSGVLLRRRWESILK